MRWLFRKLQRWHRDGYLKRGYCPLCYSSPPWPDCPICEGNFRYGHSATPLTRKRWYLRWREFNGDGRK